MNTYPPTSMEVECLVRLVKRRPSMIDNHYDHIMQDQLAEWTVKRVVDWPNKRIVYNLHKPLKKEMGIVITNFRIVNEPSAMRGKSE